MAYYYPHKSHLKNELSKCRENIDYYVWFDKMASDLQDKISKINEPIIELGGPSDLGYYFLDSLNLSSKPIITNLSKDIAPYSNEDKAKRQTVNNLVDARSMPYDNDSVGVFLMSYMSVSSDWWIRLEDKAKRQAAARFEEEFDVAKIEMSKAALGIIKPSQAKYAQKIIIYQEIYRTLQHGGLLFCNGALEDIIILNKIGLKTVALLQYQFLEGSRLDDTRYEFVVSKT